MKSLTSVLLLTLLGAVQAHPKSHKSCPGSVVTITKTGEPPLDPSCFVCSDAFDECGNTFGPGCWDYCKTPYIPSYTTPYCSLATTTTETKTTLPATCTRTICVDYVNDCGQWYGGCHNDCLTPTYVEPPCTVTPTPSSSSGSWPASCTRTICATATNKCGNGYGYCYNECDPNPSSTVTVPPCKSQSTLFPTEPHTSYRPY